MKVFLSVGSLFPFDRLVRVVDEWCGSLDRLEAVAQIGEGSYLPRHMRHHAELDSATFDRFVHEADLIVSHAGMGIILKALSSGKSLVVMPRRVEFGEVTTDHQLATAERLEEALGLTVAWTDEELRALLSGGPRPGPGRSIREHASDELLTAVRRFIEGG